MGRLLLFLLISGVLAVPAHAAGLGELTPLSVRGSVDCGGPTGAPGELVIRTSTGVRFVTATRAGFQLGRGARPGQGLHLLAVKVRPSGAGVIAGELDGRVVAVVRDPGGTWGAPLPVASTAETSAPVSLSADVSDRGDVIVAVKAFDFYVHHPRRRCRASSSHVVRRAACSERSSRLGARAQALGDIHAGHRRHGRGVRRHDARAQAPPTAVPGARGGAPGAAGRRVRRAGPHRRHPRVSSPGAARWPLTAAR